MKKTPYTFEDFCSTVFGRKIEWIDTSNFTPSEQRFWYQEARNVLENPVFKSLCGYSDENGQFVNGEIVKNLIEVMARHSRTMEEVNFIRAKIAGIELIRQLLTDVKKPD